MNTKQSLLLIFLLCHYNALFFADSPEQNSIISRTTDSLYKNYKWLKKQVFAKDWQKKYTKKELANTKNSIIIPTIAAQDFKKAITESIALHPLMAQSLHNNANNFLFGASSSSYQYEGGLDKHNANADFYLTKGLMPAGHAIDFWNHYESDIKQMKKELGINSLRISIAWDRVQPQLNQYDEQAIKKYIHIIQTLKENNITPIVVLHHYTVPTWFEEIGGFEKQENIHYFVNFAKKMYQALHQDVVYWSTFNAVEGYAFKGYYTLDGPPGKSKSLVTTQRVMANMLEAHVQTYQAIKGTDGLYHQLYQSDHNIPLPLIGIQKNIVLLDPAQEEYIWIRTLTRPICVSGTDLQNSGFFNFFKYGTFKIDLSLFKIPFFRPPSMPYMPTHTNSLAPQSIDWIGLNIYSNMHMRFTARLQEKNPNFATENLNYRDYPEGIYRATKIINDALAKPLNIPIIITENGIATTNDAAGNEKRTRFFRRALYTIRKLIEEDCIIIGYTPWASHDNYEWPSADQPEPFTSRRYGLFFVDFSSPQLTRTLKTGAYYYRDFIKAYN